MSKDVFVYAKKKRHIRKLFELGDVPVYDSAALPKKIYFYWDKGYEAAPNFCKHCIESWRRKNPDWEVHVLDTETAKPFLEGVEPPSFISEAHKSDLLRLSIMSRHGGVWADVTTYCMRPLNHWLPFLFNHSDYFLFTQPARDRLISMWFMAALPGASNMRVFRAACVDYWHGLRKPPINYFCHHALYQYLVLTDRRFRKAHKLVPRLSSRACHVAQDALKQGLIPTEADALVVRDTPMQKLSHRHGMTCEQFGGLVAMFEN